MGLKLFYGTLTLLASDAPLLEGSRLVERVRTAPEYRLFSLDDFPAMVEAGGNGVSIEAQIWEVPDARWEAILVDEPSRVLRGCDRARGRPSHREPPCSGRPRGGQRRRGHLELRLVASVQAHTRHRSPRPLRQLGLPGDRVRRPYEEGLL